MPELPEVEAIARALRSLVLGKTIRRCRVLHPIAVRPSSGRGLPAAIRALERGSKGRRIERVERLGKFLVLGLDQGCLVMHFRLDGQLVWFDGPPIRRHVDVTLNLPGGVLGFVDRRHFGRINWFARPEGVPGIRTLGVDPLSPQFTPAHLEALLRKSRRPLKLLLLDQTRIAGLGNIYSSEALWRARLNPRRLAHRVTPAEVRRLHKATVAVLRRALECCLDPAPNLRDPGWWFAGLDKILRVYGRQGKGCRRCGGLICRIEQGGRSTFYCRGCQR